MSTSHHWIYHCAKDNHCILLKVLIAAGADVLFFDFVFLPPKKDFKISLSMPTVLTYQQSVPLSVDQPARNHNK